MADLNVDHTRNTKLGTASYSRQAVVSVRFPGSQVFEKTKKNEFPEQNKTQFGALFGYVELYAPRHRDLHKKLYLFFFGL